MSIYDTILANTQQGYQNLANQQMQMAQMPTFADKFLAGLKEREQLDYQRKMAESNLAMNQTYKLAQEQHMAQQDEQNRVAKMIQAIGLTRNVTPYTYDPVVAQVTGLGGNASWVPKQQFETNVEQVSVPSPEASELAAGAGIGAYESPEFMQQVNAEYQTPIEGTGWGTDAWQKELDRRNRLTVQELKGEQRKAIMQDKESKVALINRMLAEGKITPQQHALEVAKAVALADNRAAELAKQGIMIPAYGNLPGGAAAPSPGIPKSLPGSQTAPAPATGKTSQEKVKPLSPKGEQEVAKITAQHRTVNDDLNKTVSLIDLILKDENVLKSAVGRFKGAANESNILYSSAAEKNVIALLNRLRNSGVLSGMKSLKESGTSFGQQSDAEGRRLEQAYSSIDIRNSDPNYIILELKRLKGETVKTRDNFSKKASDFLTVYGRKLEDQPTAPDNQPDDQNIIIRNGKRYAPHSDGKYYLVDQ